MFLLHKLQEGRHVRPAKVVDGFEAGEHAPSLQSLEMILANVLEKKEKYQFPNTVTVLLQLPYQHGGTKVELMEELCDENVHLQDVGDVFCLHVSQHVDEPLEVAVGRTDPQEIYLCCWCKNKRIR